MTSEHVRGFGKERELRPATVAPRAATPCLSRLRTMLRQCTPVCGVRAVAVARNVPRNMESDPRGDTRRTASDSTPVWPLQTDMQAREIVFTIPGRLSVIPAPRCMRAVTAHEQEGDDERISSVHMTVRGNRLESVRLFALASTASSRLRTSGVEDSNVRAQEPPE